MSSLVEDVVHPQRPREGVDVRPDSLRVHPSASLGWEDVGSTHVPQDDGERLFVHRYDPILPTGGFRTSDDVSPFDVDVLCLKGQQFSDAHPRIKED